MGPSLILSVIHNSMIGTMLNNNSGNNGHGLRKLWTTVVLKYVLLVKWLELSKDVSCSSSPSELCAERCEVVALAVERRGIAGRDTGGSPGDVKGSSGSTIPGPETVNVDVNHWRIRSYFNVQAAAKIKEKKFAFSTREQALSES